MEAPTTAVIQARSPQQLAALRAIAPISQILYGSDYPFANEHVLRAAEAAFAASPLHTSGEANAETRPRLACSAPSRPAAAGIEPRNTWPMN
jgi:hypothetical protein